MKDIDIARKANIKHITNIAKSLNIPEEYIIPYGKYKAKIDNTLFYNLSEKKQGKLILVTSINPTPLGEGKTTVSIG